MKFSYRWLKELAQFKEPPEKLADFLTLRVFEVESMTKRGGDTILDIKLLPNRLADASGHTGMAQEIATLKNVRIRKQEARITETAQKASEILRVEIENPDDCWRYTARVMSDVKIGPSPKWIRERLGACGLQSINNVVDAANYVMLELGQPLHVFDFDKLKTRGRGTKAIVVRRARKGEKLLALDEKTYPLSPEILVIADEKEPIAIAGIKGGKHSGVTSRTRAIVLESANFDPVRTRLASRALNLKTDASHRFEHGLDPSSTERAIDRLAEVIQRVASGEILAGRVDAYPRRSPVIRLPLRTDYANRVIGENIPFAFYETGLRRLGWNYRRQGRVDFAVTPPPERLDIRIEEDIIEEMARLWGYEKIPGRAPHAPLAPAAANEERQWEERVRDVLVGAGLVEVFAYEFVSRRILDDFSADAKRLLELENPTSPETQYLIAHPAQQYIRIASENLRRFDEIGIFGIAKGFRPTPRPSAKMPSEEKKYLVITKGTKEPKSSRDSGETFYTVKGVIDQMLESLGIADHWYDDVLTKDERQKAHALHPYRTAKVMVGDEFLGVVAELHPAVLKRLKSRGRIVFAEISFEKLWRMSRAEAEFRPVGRFPAVVRDIAVIVPENTKTEAVTNVIENAGGELLADSDLFDYFQDEAMEERGEKSLAFHLVFQSPERTLTDEEVNRIYKKIVSAAREKGLEIRE